VSQKKINILITLLFILLFFVVFSNRIVMINGPAKVAVIFKPFSGGVDVDHVYREGIYLIWPWNTAYQFNIRQQLVDTTIKILMENGVTTNVQINYRFWPLPDSLPVIFRKYGVKYPNIIVQPEVESAVRIVISDLTPEQLYDMHFDTIRRQILWHAQKNLKLANVNLEDLVILKIELPKRVVEAIESKLQQEQLVKEYDFKDSVAERQKRIRIVEASAIKMAEDTINKGLTPEYLQLRQIEAFEKLSLSNNSKTIIVPRSSTPVMFNGQ